MTYIYLLLSVLIFLEFFESHWQKAPNLYGVMINNYIIFQKNIFIYFLLNPTFMYSIFLSFYLNLFNFWMSSIVVIKFIDIAFRLHIITKMNKGIELAQILPTDIKMNNYFRYLNVLIYPLSLIFAVGR